MTHYESNLLSLTHMENCSYLSSFCMSVDETPDNGVDTTLSYSKSGQPCLSSITAL